MNATIKNETKATTANFHILLKKFGATSGLSLGLILLVTGIILSVFAFFEKTNFDNAELIMIVTSFVFLGLGAHCLDLLEKGKISKRG